MDSGAPSRNKQFSIRSTKLKIVLVKNPTVPLFILSRCIKRTNAAGINKKKNQ